MQMKKTMMGLCMGLALLSSRFAEAQIAPANANVISGGELVGRWDLTVLENGKPKASWLEVEISGFRTLVGRFVGSSGSARPVSKIIPDHNRFSFTIPPQWEASEKDMVLDGEITSDGIKGTIHSSDGQEFSFTGVRAPFLTEKTKVKWGKPIRLFNGKDLTGWTVDGTKNQWVVKNGELISPESGSNIVTTRKFRDFKLHIEFKYQKGSNSGVYLRGRYETQILDVAPTDHPNSHLFGGIYGFLVPSEIAATGPEQWQSYDITLVGRMITVVANGKTIICNQEIPGITGGAIDSNEGEPGPIYLQGDHGPISFRNIIITPGE